jgi:hypothetical protein
MTSLEDKHKIQRPKRITQGICEENSDEAQLKEVIWNNEVESSKAHLKHSVNNGLSTQ